MVSSCAISGRSPPPTDSRGLLHRHRLLLPTSDPDSLTTYSAIMDPRFFHQSHHHQMYPPELASYQPPQAVYTPSPTQSPPSSSAGGSPSTGPPYPQETVPALPWEDEPATSAAMGGAFAPRAPAPLSRPSTSIGAPAAPRYPSSHSPMPQPPLYPQSFGAAEEHRPPAQYAEPEGQYRPPPKAVTAAGTPITGPYGALSRALTHREQTMLGHLDRLKYFLATAPSRWGGDGPASGAQEKDGAQPATTNGAEPAKDAEGAEPATAGNNPSALPVGHPQSNNPALNRFSLPNGEFVSCVLWNGLYHITGTDIVRALVFRFEAFGRPVQNMKKFEEGIFSDLRNLKPGQDACLEEPKVGRSSRRHGACS